MSRRNGRDGSIAYCPACDARIYFRKLPRRGATITCGECESLLSIVRVSPIQLQWAFEDPFEEERFGSRNGNDHADEKTYDDYEDYEYYDEDYDFDLD